MIRLSPLMLLGLLACAPADADKDDPDTDTDGTSDSDTDTTGATDTDEGGDDSDTDAAVDDTDLSSAELFSLHGPTPGLYTFVSALSFSPNGCNGNSSLFGTGYTISNVDTDARTMTVTSTSENWGAMSCSYGLDGTFSCATLSQSNSLNAPPLFINATVSQQVQLSGTFVDQDVAVEGVEQTFGMTESFDLSGQVDMNCSSSSGACWQAAAVLLGSGSFPCMSGFSSSAVMLPADE